MKEYILYIVVALAIVGVIAVYFITNKKIASLENEIVNLSEGFNKLQSIVQTNKTLETADPFNQTINNITPNPTGGASLQASYNQTMEVNETNSETVNSQSSSNLRLRYHLGVDVPEPDLVKIRVGDEIKPWIQDKCIVFDDSFEHEVFHNGKKDRIVFIVDLWHPKIKDSYVNILKLDEFKNFGKL